MEKILVVNGSPRKDRGNSIKLAKEFLKGYLEVEKTAQIEYIHTYDLDIKNCGGCFACWKETPGKCIFKDDMTMVLEKILEADIVLWVTPLYHYGMTSSLKKLVERTLPFNEPLIVQSGDQFNHPQRYDLSKQKNILISTCGFPHHKVFDTLVEKFEKITPNGLDEKILCVMGELLSVKPLERKISWYLDAVSKSGREYASTNKIEEETKKLLNKTLVPVEDFIEMANLSWNIEKNESSKEKNNNSDSRNKGKNFLTLMGYSYTGKLEKNLEIQFNFTDLDEWYYFDIKDDRCKLIEGRAEDPNLIIKTPFDIWLDISNGKLDGTQGLMDGKYKVEGDLNILIKLGDLFGNGKKEKVDEKKTPTPKNGEKWMTYPIVAWVLIWSLGSSNYRLGLLSSIILMLGVLFIKRKRKYEVTFLERSTFLYLLTAGILYQENIEISLYSSYFICGIIWGVGAFNELPLTGEYSKYRFKDNIKKMVKSPIFIKINRELTLLWAGIFLLQGGIKFLYLDMSSMYFTMISVGIIFIATRITKWYPEYMKKKIMEN